MKEFRMFKWTLAPEEWKKVEEWQACQVLSSKDKIMNRQKALKDLEEKQRLRTKDAKTTMSRLLWCWHHLSSSEKRPKHMVPQLILTQAANLTLMAGLRTPGKKTLESWRCLVPRPFD